MIRLNNKPTSFNLSIPYSALLEVETIANLKEGFGMLGMCFSGQPKKAQIVKSYAKYVKEHPKDVLRTLSPDSLTLLNEILKQGKDGYVTIEGIEVFNQLQKTNLVVTWENEADNASYLYLIEEIYDLFGPLIDETLNTPVDYSSMKVKTPLDAVVYELVTKCKEISGDINKFMKRKNIDTLTEKELDYYEEGLRKHNAALAKYTGKLTSLINSNPDGFGGWEELIKVALAYVNQVQALIDESRDKLAARRESLLKQDSESLKQQIAAAEQRKVQTTGSFTPRRNDPCPCGSGKKYKHCCGKF